MCVSEVDCNSKNTLLAFQVGLSNEQFNRFLIADVK